MPSLRNRKVKGRTTQCQGCERVLPNREVRVDIDGIDGVYCLHCASSYGIETISEYNPSEHHTNERTWRVFMNKSLGTPWLPTIDEYAKGCFSCGKKDGYLWITAINVPDGKYCAVNCLPMLVGYS